MFTHFHNPLWKRLQDEDILSHFFSIGVVRRGACLSVWRPQTFVWREAVTRRLCLSFLSSVSRTAALTGDRKKCLALLPRRRMGGEGWEGGGEGGRWKSEGEGEGEGEGHGERWEVRGGRKRGRETDRGYRRGRGEERESQRGQEMGAEVQTTVSQQSCRERGEPKRERKVVVTWMFPWEEYNLA